MILISLITFITLINLIQSNQIVQLNQLNLTEELDYENYMLHNFKTNYKLQIIPSSSQFSTQDSRLYVTARFDREALIEASQCQANCVLELKIASYDDQNNIQKIYNLPVFIQDVNDQRPEFKNSEFVLNISENLSSKTIVSLQPPVDLDSNENSVQTCTILSQTDTFSLNFNKESKKLFLVIDQSLDRETQSQFTLNISCSDNKTSTEQILIINVLDTNDNIPFFLDDTYNVTIEENYIGDLVQVKASDLDDPETLNSKLKFSIEENSDFIKSSFFINETSGVLSLKNPLDFEKLKKVYVKVKCQDMGANPVPIYTNVLVNILDMNDNAPQAQFSYVDKYVSKENRSNNTIWVLEGQNFTLPLSLGFFTLTDFDSAQVNGFNLSAELSSIYYMDSKTGGLREEIEPSFRLAPIIQEYNNVYYTLQLIKNLDRELTGYFDIKIKLSDNNGAFSLQTQKPQFSFVFVRVIVEDLNDNPPKFTQESFKYFIKENEMSLNFGCVQAVDDDLTAELEYRILDSDDEVNPNFLFFINPSNGSLSLRGGLDREKKEFYNFTVRVSDGVYTSDVKVDVKVMDENDNEPFYKDKHRFIEIDENLKLNSIIGNFKPIDLDIDSKIEYNLIPFEINNYFIIDTKSGNLKNIRNLDAEKTKFFNFTIQVKDSEYPTYSSSLNISIHVKDLNDNQPEVLFNTNMIKLNDLNCSTLKLTSYSVQDLDRDEINRDNTVKLGQIRRLSWSLVGDILKNYNNKSSDLDDLTNYLDQVTPSKSLKQNLRNYFSLSANDLVLNSCKLNPGFYNLSVQVNDSSSIKMYSIKVLIFNGTDKLNQSHFDLMTKLVEQWWSVNSVYLNRRSNDLNHSNEDLDSFVYSNLTSSKQILSLTSLILLSKGSNFLIVTILAFILIILILLITIFYKSVTYKPKSDQKKMLNIKFSDSSDSSSLTSAKIKNIKANPVQDSFTVITTLTDKTRHGSIGDDSYMKTFSTGKTDDLQVNDMGYYGSSDYSDSFQQKCKKLKNDSFTSSSVLSSPSTVSDASSSYRPIVTNMYPQQQQQPQKQDVKIYLERFERIYNSDSVDSNSIQNRITTYSYV